MNKMLSRLLTVVALLAVIALVAVVAATPAQAAASPMSPGCAFFNSPAADFDGYVNSYPPMTFNAGETLTVVVTGSTTSSTLRAGSYVDTLPGIGTLSITFSSVITDSVSIVDDGGFNMLHWDFSCTTVPATSDDPFFQFSMPAQGIHLDEAREVPYMGQLPIDVFEPHWWGVKVLNSTNFPKLAGIDLTTVEVLCMDASGNWSGEWVTEWSATSSELEVLIKQHGICGIFSK